MVLASGKYSLGICGRCNYQCKYEELREDGNIKGLWVCRREGCYDTIDPFRLPPPPADAIALGHARPDVDLTVQPTATVTPEPPDNETGIVISNDEGVVMTPDDGSIMGVSKT